MNTDHLSHVDDPWTSNHAAVNLDPNATVGIMHAIITMLAEKPMTDDELKHAYQARAEREGWPLTLDLHNIARRRSTLHRKHKVVEASGEHRPSDHNRPAIVWRLTHAADTCRIIIGLPSKVEAA